MNKFGLLAALLVGGLSNVGQATTAYSWNYTSWSDAVWAVERQMVEQCGENAYVPKHASWSRLDCCSTSYYFSSPYPYCDGAYPPGRATYNHCVVQYECAR